MLLRESKPGTHLVRSHKRLGESCERLGRKVQASSPSVEQVADPIQQARIRAPALHEAPGRVRQGRGREIQDMFRREIAERVE